MSKNPAHPLHPVHDDGTGGDWKWWECHFVLLNSHILAYTRCLARKVCGLVRSTWGTSQGEDNCGARDRILNTKAVRRACAGQTFPQSRPQISGPFDKLHFLPVESFSDVGGEWVGRVWPGPQPPPPLLPREVLKQWPVQGTIRQRVGELSCAGPRPSLPRPPAHRYSNYAEWACTAGLDNWVMLTKNDHLLIAAHIFARIPTLKARDFVLDWGSGCGTKLRHLAQRHRAHGFGIDLVDTAVRHANAADGTSCFCHTDGSRLQWLPSQAFDHVISFGAFYHLFMNGTQHPHKQVRCPLSGAEWGAGCMPLLSGGGGGG